MLSATRLAREAAAKLWPSLVAWSQQSWRWLVKQHDPITWTVLRARLTSLPLLPNSNAGRLAVLVGLVVLLLLVLPWYAKGHKDKNGVVTYPNATLINPILAGIGATLLIYAAIRQAQTASSRHAAQTDADRQQRVTESFSKAIEQLGSDKLEVRLGGIYALERISHESPQDYWTVMETLTAFVRERTRRERPLERRKAERAHRLWEDAGKPEGRSEEFWRTAVRLETFGKPATDIATVLTVIGRRSVEHRALEIRDKRRLDLERAVLRNADLRGAHLERANLWGAHLEGAYLGEAHLDHAWLFDAHFNSAYLNDAHFEGAFLQGAHFHDARGLTQDQIDTAFGNLETNLPAGLTRPAHWSQSQDEQTAHISRVVGLT